MGSPGGDLPRRIGFWGGSAVMVGIIIGSGIFATPPRIAGQLASPAAILALWVAGGLLSLFGALTYAELGTMFPRSGGIYVFLHQGLGGMVAFVFGWTYMLIAKPLAAAGIVSVFGTHFNNLFGLTWDSRIAPCALILLFTAVNVIGVRQGTGLAMVLTGLKLAALGAIVLLGLTFTGPVPAPPPAEARPSFWLALSPVLLMILWTYDGWSDIASVAGEVENPSRTLPRMLLAGTAATVAIYLAVNAAYLAVVPLEEMRTTDKLAPLVMERLLGRVGARAVDLVVVLSTAGATLGSILTGARVTFAQARDGLLFRFLGRIHPRRETPDAALWLQAALSCAAIVGVGEFEKLAGGFTFTMWIFYALAAVSVLVLRVRRPDLDRPYRCWGFPWVPIVFILVSLGMIVMEVVRDPRQKLPWLAVLVAGVPVYYIWKRFAKPRVDSGV